MWKGPFLQSVVSSGLLGRAGIELKSRKDGNAIQSILANSYTIMNRMRSKTRIHNQNPRGTSPRNNND